MHQAHAHLPVPAPVGSALPHPPDQRLEVGPVTCAGRESSRQYVDRASPDTASRCASRCPCPASRFTSAALSRLVTSTPAGHAIFPGRRPSPPGTRAARPAPARAWQPAPARWMNPGAGPWPGAAAPRRPPPARYSRHQRSNGAMLAIWCLTDTPAPISATARRRTSSPCRLLRSTPIKRTTPPTIESEFHQSHNRGAVHPSSASALCICVKRDRWRTPHVPNYAEGGCDRGE